MVTCLVRAWKKKLAPWRNRTIPVHPSTNNSTIISFLNIASTKQGLIYPHAETNRVWVLKFLTSKPKNEVYALHLEKAKSYNGRPDDKAYG